jgi:soluble lytic murein transglycosylase
MILTPKPNSALKTLLCGALALFFAMPAPAQGKSDDVLLEMQQAFKQGRQKAPRCTLLPQARGHVLEPWAAYWELKCPPGRNLAPRRCRTFMTRYAGTYQEDRHAQRLAAAARAAARLDQLCRRTPQLPHER